MITNPFTQQVINTSYFSECERDERGWCLPKDKVGPGLAGGPMSKELTSVSRDSPANIAVKLRRFGRKPIRLEDVGSDILSELSEQDKSKRYFRTGVDGLSLVFPQGWDLEKVATRIQPSLHSPSVPRSVGPNKKGYYKRVQFEYDPIYSKKLLEANRAIVFVDGENANLRNNPWGLMDIEASASDNGVTTVYNGGPLSRVTLAHEAAHNLAEKTWGSYSPPTNTELGRLIWEESKRLSDMGGDPRYDYVADASEIFARKVEQASTPDGLGNMYVNEPRMASALVEFLYDTKEMPEVVYLKRTGQYRKKS